MFILIMSVVIPGGLLFVDRYKYFLSSPMQALCWFIFVVQGIVLLASLIEGKPLVFTNW